VSIVKGCWLTFTYVFLSVLVYVLFFNIKTLLRWLVSKLKTWWRSSPFVINIVTVYRKKYLNCEVHYSSYAEHFMLYLKVYTYGFQWFIGNVGFFIANIISIIIVVPLVHPLKITSAYEVSLQPNKSFIGFKSVFDVCAKSQAPIG